MALSAEAMLHGHASLRALKAPKVMPVACR
jgi:hypothetical protein